MSRLLANPHHAQNVLLVVVVIFVLVPLAFRALLKLLEPDLEGKTPLRRAMERRFRREVRSG